MVHLRNSVSVQWLRLHASTAGGVRELRSHMPCQAAKKKKIYFMSCDFHTNNFVF